MFGFVAFSAAPFASLGGSNYAVSLSDGWTVGAVASTGASLLFEQITEQSRVSDASNGIINFTGAWVDSVQFSDSMASAAINAAVTSESIQSQDTVSTATAFVATVSSSASGADTAAVAAAQAASTQEQTRMLDAQSSLAAMGSAIQEQATASIAFTPSMSASGAYSDTVRGADVLSGSRFFDMQLVEFGTFEDQRVLRAIVRGATADFVYAQADASVLLSSFASVLERLFAADTSNSEKITTSNTLEFAAVTSREAGGKSLTAQVPPETVAVIDAIPSVVRAGGTIVENAIVSDTRAFAYTARASFTAAVRGSDNFTALQLSVVTLSDRVTARDSASGVSNIPAQVSEGTAISEAVNLLLTRNVDFSDSVRVADSVSLVLLNTAFIDDAFAASHMQSTIAAFRADTADAVRAVEAMTGGTFTLHNINEAASVVASFLGKNAWAPADTNINANWAPEPTNVNASWSPETTNVDANWTSVTTLN